MINKFCFFFQTSIIFSENYEQPLTIGQRKLWLIFFVFFDLSPEITYFGQWTHDILRPSVLYWTQVNLLLIMPRHG